MPRVRHGGREKLVGLHVFGDGQAREEMLGQVQRVQRVQIGRMGLKKGGAAMGLACFLGGENPFSHCVTAPPKGGAEGVDFV